MKTSHKFSTSPDILVAKEKKFSRTVYTLFQNGRYLDILLFLFKLDLDASFKAKYSFEF